MIKILNVVGNRPHMIKNAVLQKTLCSKHNVIVVHTGQHYDYEMSDIFFKEFEMKEPKYNIGVGSGTHGETTGRIMCGLEPILKREKPDVILVHGDTNSTLAAALTAAKMRYPVAHVEAGLRSYNLHMPEEVNRRCVDHVSSVLFCPCKSAYQNLKREGLLHVIGSYGGVAERVRSDVARTEVVGDVMIDTLKHYTDKIESVSNEYCGYKYAIATIHREENTTNVRTIQTIFNAFEDYGEKIIFPMHPRTGVVVATHGIHIPKNVTVVKPLGYFEMIKLVKESDFVITDSGGLQKEAYILKIPCITLRSETEWEDTISGNWNTLVDATSHKDIVAMMRYRNEYKPDAASHKSYYGSGDASEKILKILTEVYDK